MSDKSPAERYVERMKKEAELKKHQEKLAAAELRYFRTKFPHPYPDELEPFLND